MGKRTHHGTDGSDEASDDVRMEINMALILLLDEMHNTNQAFKNLLKEVSSTSQENAKNLAEMQLMLKELLKSQ